VKRMKVATLGALTLAASTLLVSQPAPAQRGFRVAMLAAPIYGFTLGAPIYGYYHYGYYGYYPKYDYLLVPRPYGHNAYRPYGHRYGYPGPYYGYGYGPIPIGL
jgi:hypothetical protein